MNEILFVGYDARHGGDFEFNSESNGNSYMLIMTNTPVLIETDGVMTEYPEHTAVLYAPHSKVHYRGIGDVYSDNWIRFKSDETYVNEFPLANTAFSVSEPEYIHNLIQLITWETTMSLTSPREMRHSGLLMFSSEERAAKAELLNSRTIEDLFRILFDKLKENVVNEPVGGYYTKLLDIRKQIANSPNLSWTVPEIAGRLNLSEGYLQYIYKKEFGVSCMDDVISFRLRKAEDYLKFSNLSMSEIAEKCGYNSNEHFLRQFKARLGMTPGQYRKNGGKPQQ